MNEKYVPAWKIQKTKEWKDLLQYFEMLIIQGKEKELTDLLEQKKQVLQEIQKLEETIKKEKQYSLALEQRLQLEKLNKQYGEPKMIKVASQTLALDVNETVEDFGFFPESETEESIAIMLSTIKEGKVTNTSIFTYDIKAKKILDIYYLNINSEELNVPKTLILK